MPYSGPQTERSLDGRPVVGRVVLQLLLGQELARVPHEQLQQRQLGARQVHLFAGAADAAAREVDLEVVEVYQRERLGGVRGATQRGAYTCEQLFDVERLGDVVVRPRVESANLLGLLVVRGQHDHRDARERAYAAQGLQPVDVGKPEVEHDDVGPAARCEDHGLLAGVRLGDLEIATAHHRAQRATQRGIVLDEQDRGHAAGASRGNVHTNVAPPPGVSS